MVDRELIVESGMAGYVADCAVFADCEIVRSKLGRLGPIEAVVLIVGRWSYVSQLVLVAVSDVADCDCLMSAKIGTLRVCSIWS